jgi:Leucine-rich repeat (LRR) protein
LQHLKGLTQLQTFDLSDTQVTDAGLEHLKELTQLQTLDLSGTEATDEGVKRLQQALPNCTIEP